MRAYRKNPWAALALALLASASLAGCGDDGGDSNPDAAAPDAPTDQPDAPPDDSVVMVSDITADTTWVATKTYILPGFKPTFVKNNATLTIEPGTVIKGEQASLLAITRGAKINAAGTKEKPILFTTSQADDKKARGFWGGVLILGKAPINTNVRLTTPSQEAVFEAFSESTADGKFGGTEAADNSGTLKYVRIEFAGYNFTADREFNNLTLCGVGSGTTIDFVQVHGGADDGVELFGGTVNLKHIVSTQNQDDGFDTDNGWNGKAQFVIVQDVGPQAAAEASNGYESDNHSQSTSFDADPRTKPTIYNVTLVGKASGGGSFGNYAARFRRGTQGHYYNHIWLDFQRPIEFLDAATMNASLTATNFFIKNSIIFKKDVAQADWFTTGFATGQNPDGAIDETLWIFADGPAWANRYVDPQLTDPSNLTAPNFAPKAGSPVTTGFAAPPAGDAFFDATVNFVGAVGTDDWTQGWTAYPQPAGFGQ
jgi:hypothetical protein